MKFLRSIALAFSMFSRLPAPRVSWKGENRRYLLCAMPLVGAVIGLFIWLWSRLAGVLDLGVSLTAAGITLLPLAITGGIHLDGLGDTLDALASGASPERKREILKDPTSGVFAVIGVAAYLLLYFALASELPLQSTSILSLGLIHVLSRIWCALSVISFPAAADGGLLKMVKEPADKKGNRAFLWALLALCTAGMLILDWRVGAAAAAAAALCALHVLTISRRQFGGMSGDLAGYLLQVTELAALGALVLVLKVVAAPWS